MNAYEQLHEIRFQLEDMGANDKTFEIVDQFIAKMEPIRNDQMSVSLVSMVRHLSRSREVLNCPEAHHDILGLLGDLEDRRPDEDATHNAWEDTERKPKPHSYYKSQKEQEKKKP